MSVKKVHFHEVSLQEKTDLHEAMVYLAIFTGVDLSERSLARSNAELMVIVRLDFVIREEVEVTFFNAHRAQELVAKFVFDQMAHCSSTWRVTFASHLPSSS